MRWLVAILFLLSGASHAQTVQQTGSVSPGHLSCWVTTGLIQDCGTPLSPKVTAGLGIQSANQASIGINNAKNTGAYNQLGFGVTTDAGWITLTPLGGAPNIPLNIVAPSLNFIINGVTYPFGSAGTGVYLPLSGGTLVGGLGIAISNASTASNYFIINNQDTFTWPNTGGSCCRTRLWQDRVTLTGTTNAILESNYFPLLITGTGTTTGEAFNIVHPYVDIGAGINISGYAHLFEGSATNRGTVREFRNMSAQYENVDGATTQTWIGHFSFLTNDNTTPGSVGEIDHILIFPHAGPGSAATNTYAMKNWDPLASISTLGHVNIGIIATADANVGLRVRTAGHLNSEFAAIFSSDNANIAVFRGDGGVVFGGNVQTGFLQAYGGLFSASADNTGSTFSLVSQNSSGGNLLTIAGNGNAQFNGSLDVFGTTAPHATGNTSGDVALIARNQAATTLFSLRGDGGVTFGHAGTWSANGSVATTMTSLGPTGSHTTVQKWFTVVDDTGTTRYIPAY